MVQGTGDIPLPSHGSPLQDHPQSAEGHVPDPAAGQGSQCDSPKQAAGQESPALPVPSTMKVMLVPPACPGEGTSPGHLTHPSLLHPRHVRGLGVWPQRLGIMEEDKSCCQNLQFD